MKKRYLLFLFILTRIFCLELFAQTPQYFNYQTVVRNNQGEVMAYKLVNFRMSVIKGSANGSIVYSETHEKATNEFGLVTLMIGNGSLVQGNFETIEWASDVFFLKTEIDADAGTNFVFMGTSQLLSVPYSLHAQTATTALDDNDTDPTNELQTITKEGNVVTLSHNGGSFIDSDNQTLTAENNQLTISGGNTVIIDTNPTNELQTITKEGNIVTLSHSGGSFIDSDNQTLSLTGTELSISGGNSVSLGGTVDLDWDPTNELQELTVSNDTLRISMGNEVVLSKQYLFISGDTLSISMGNDILLPMQNLFKNGDTIMLTHSNGYIFDSDNQNLSLEQDSTQITLHISGGTSVSFSIEDNDNDPFNELQYLSYNNDSLEISLGNKVLIRPKYEYAIFNDLNGPSSVQTGEINIWIPRAITSTQFIYGNSILRNNNDIILKKGLYYIKSYCFNYRGAIQTRFYNITENKTEIMGTYAVSNWNEPSYCVSYVDGIISVLNDNTIYTLQHKLSQTTYATTLPTNWNDRILTRIIIKKLD